MVIKTLCSLFTKSKPEAGKTERNREPHHHQVTAPDPHPAVWSPQLGSVFAVCSERKSSPKSDLTCPPEESLFQTGNTSGLVLVAPHRTAVPDLSSCCLILLSYQRNGEKDSPGSPSSFSPPPRGSGTFFPQSSCWDSTQSWSQKGNLLLSPGRLLSL